MSETKFTPGPYRVEVSGYADDPEGWNIYGPQGLICGDQGIYMESEHEAKLFAASPELYEALEYLTKWPLSNLATQRAFSALAKARGEA